VRVRRAIWHAIDREGMAKSLLSGTGQAAWQFLPPKNPAHRANLPNPYPYDPEKAKALLAEAGVAPGTKLTIRHPNEGSSYMRPKEMSQFVQANLKAVGLDATLEGMEWGAFVAAGAKVIEPTTQLNSSAWQSISHDPYMLEQLFSCEFRTPKGSNFGQYCNEELEKAFLAARTETDPAKAIPLYQKAEDMMLQDVPGLPIANDFSPRAIRKQVKGLIQGPSTFFDLYQVWIEK
jgi:ABC-type transport system substrate-binding protein